MADDKLVLPDPELGTRKLEKGRCAGGLQTHQLEQYVASSRRIADTPLETSQHIVYRRIKWIPSHGFLQRLERGNRLAAPVVG